MEFLKNTGNWVLWLTPVILTTWEVEIRRIMVQGHLRQKVHENLSQPIKKGCGVMHLSFQLCKKRK
jgi:hypothetical protein